jgi:hypothetical protein
VVLSPRREPRPTDPNRFGPFRPHFGAFRAVIVANRKKPAPVYGRIRTALETTITELERLGRLAGTDAARVEIARTLADQLDEDPRSAILWREYRAAEKQLREETNEHSDPFDQLLASLSAQVRDEEKPKKAKPRT